MKKSKWLDFQGNEFFPKQKGTPSLVKIEHKNTATLDSARSKKNKVAVLQLQYTLHSESKLSTHSLINDCHDLINLEGRQNNPGPNEVGLLVD